MSMKAFCIGVNDHTGQVEHGAEWQIGPGALKALEDTKPLTFGNTEMTLDDPLAEKETEEPETLSYNNFIDFAD